MKTSLIRKFSTLAGVLTLASCASMIEANKARVCQKTAAYEEGFNDGRDGAPMNSAKYSICESSADQIKVSYQEGYKAGSVSAQTSTPPPTQGGNNTVIQIGVGNTNNSHGSGSSANNRAWYCEVHAFTKTYSSFGPTELEAKNNALSSCAKATHKMHCDEVSCRPNH